jgi:hypothetical protein
MRWNWQLPDWPDFRFDPDKLRARETQFLMGSGVIIGSLHHIDGAERDGLTVEQIAQEVVESSAIEGEVLNRTSVQSSLAKQLGFATDPHCNGPLPRHNEKHGWQRHGTSLPSLCCRALQVVLAARASFADQCQKSAKSLWQALRGQETSALS